jgi:hypothetical protein
VTREEALKIYEEFRHDWGDKPDSNTIMEDIPGIWGKLEWFETGMDYANYLMAKNVLDNS